MLKGGARRPRRACWPCAAETTRRGRRVPPTGDAMSSSRHSSPTRANVRTMSGPSADHFEPPCGLGRGEVRTGSRQDPLRVGPRCGSSRDAWSLRRPRVRIASRPVPPLVCHSERSEESSERVAACNAYEAPSEFFASLRMTIEGRLRSAYNRTRRRRRALVTTLIELRLIATLASIGCSSQPVSG